MSGANNRLPKIVKNDVPNITDLLRYWPMFGIFGGKAKEVCYFLYYSIQYFIA